MTQPAGCNRNGRWSNCGGRGAKAGALNPKTEVLAGTKLAVPKHAEKKLQLKQSAGVLSPIRNFRRRGAGYAKVRKRSKGKSNTIS